MSSKETKPFLSEPSGSWEEGPASGVIPGPALRSSRSSRPITSLLFRILRGEFCVSLGSARRWRERSGSRGCWLASHPCRCVALGPLLSKPSYSTILEGTAHFRAVAITALARCASQTVVSPHLDCVVFRVCADLRSHHPLPNSRMFSSPPKETPAH